VSAGDDTDRVQGACELLEDAAIALKSFACRSGCRQDEYNAASDLGVGASNAFALESAA
jgi:hypothetical protein